ncbi:hypothetical protein [Oscillatoria sp. HE19RPO]|uniref:hypothetical protein n=1 Tax=Oscillatoria sp. HE19RPO TaxID=2954806 RepID=UPI0020C51BE7|nr:hypothetical protein [Oscillatoria sp. HE19RPO]
MISDRDWTFEHRVGDVTALIEECCRDRQGMMNSAIARGGAFPKLTHLSRMQGDLQGIFYPLLLGGCFSHPAAPKKRLSWLIRTPPRTGLGLSCSPPLVEQLEGKNSNHRAKHSEHSPIYLLGQFQRFDGELEVI